MNIFDQILYGPLEFKRKYKLPFIGGLNKMKCEECGKDGARNVFCPVCMVLYNKTNVVKTRCPECEKKAFEEANKIRKDQEEL